MDDIAAPEKFAAVELIGLPHPVPTPAHTVHHEPQGHPAVRADSLSRPTRGLSIRELRRTRPHDLSSEATKTGEPIARRNRPRQDMSLLATTASGTRPSAGSGLQLLAGTG